MIPDWVENWNIWEAATVLLADFPNCQAELPYERCPADQRLDTVWEKLSPGCRSLLEIRRNEFLG